MKNTFGNLFCISSFGESHGHALGVLIDGCPANIDFDQEKLIADLARRRPGGALVSGRREQDQPEILSGVFTDKTLGTPIAIIVRNVDQRSGDYEQIKMNPRVGHADDTWKAKYGHTDHRGGGRSSGRETVARVMAGSVAEMVLQQKLDQFECVGFAETMGPLKARNIDYQKITREQVDQQTARFGDASQSQEVETLLKEAKENGQSYGGTVGLVIRGVPAGLGQPVFHKLKSDLAAAMMSVGATSGVEIGAGFAAVDEVGTEFHKEGSEDYGGIRGGISTGETIYVRIAFKPTSTVLDVAKKGRHDPCIVTRAIPVVEAMASLVIVDHLLWAQTDQ